nr:MAG TPA: hypothetical protein [Caudoviricetes sp.]
MSGTRASLQSPTIHLHDILLTTSVAASVARVFPPPMKR